MAFIDNIKTDQNALRALTGEHGETVTYDGGAAIGAWIEEDEYETREQPDGSGRLRVFYITVSADDVASPAFKKTVVARSTTLKVAGIEKAEDGWILRCERYDQREKASDAYRIARG